HDTHVDPSREGVPVHSPLTCDYAFAVLSHIDENATDVQTAALTGLVGKGAAEAFMRWRIEAADFDLRAVLEDPTVENWTAHHPSKTLTVLGAGLGGMVGGPVLDGRVDRKSTRLNSSHVSHA